MILIVILYALFASTFSLGKVLLNYSQPVFLVGIRMFIAGALLLAYQYFYAHKTFKFHKNHIWYYLQGMLFTIYIPYLLRFWALNYMPSSKACLLYTFGPFISYFLSYFLYAERITLKKITGLIIGFIGLLPILAHSSTQGISTALFIGLPEMAIILSVTSLSYGWIILRKMINEHAYSPTMINGICMLGGGFMALITSFFIEYPAYVNNILPFIGILAIIIFVSNLICHNVYASLLRKYSPTMLSFASFLSPLFAALYGWLFMRETISWQFYASTFVVFIGLSLFYQDELKTKQLQATLD